jgi:polysaccharide pyruvyl transferase WcaK-like protein
MFRKRIILAFQGIGPWKTQMGEWCTRWVVERSALTVVRDEESLRRITQWKNKKYVQSCDPVLSLLSSSQDRGSGKRFVIIPRANASQEFLDLAKAEGMKAKERGETVCIASLEPEAHGEGMICGELARHLDAPIVCPSTRQELMSVMQDASYVLTQRYHGAIAALGMGIPFHAFPQASGDKLDAVAEMDRETALEAVERGERALREVLSQRI